MSEQMTRVTDVVDLLNKVCFVQYNTGWSSTSLAKYAADEITRLRQLLSEAEKREREARAKAVEDVLSALTAHELYQYRPKAFQGFIEYARREFGSTPVRKPAVDSGESGDE